MINGQEVFSCMGYVAVWLGFGLLGHVVGMGIALASGKVQIHNNKRVWASFLWPKRLTLARNGNYVTIYRWTFFVWQTEKEETKCVKRCDYF
jgi:hypothetical protein